MCDDVFTSSYAFVLYTGTNVQLLTARVCVDLGSGWAEERRPSVDFDQKLMYFS